MKRTDRVSRKRRVCMTDRRWYYESGKGRLDINGLEWFTCDPYGTWYRIERDEQSVAYPIKWADGLGNWPTVNQIREVYG